MALSNAFYSCESRKVRAIQLKDSEYIDSSLALAKTKDEKVAIYAFKSTNNPAPTLNYIQK